MYRAAFAASLCLLTSLPEHTQAQAEGPPGLAMVPTARVRVAEIHEEEDDHTDDRR
jgi:hypothetical protein